MRQRAASGFIGVHRRNRGFEASVKADGGRVRLGPFADPISAAAARDAEVRRRYGPQGFYNFPAPGEMAVLKTDDPTCVHGHSLAEHGVSYPYRLRPQCKLCQMASLARSNARRRLPAAVNENLPTLADSLL